MKNAKIQLKQLTKDLIAKIYINIEKSSNLFSDFEWLIKRISDNEEYGDLTKRINQSTFYAYWDESTDTAIALVEFVYSPSRVKIMDVHEINEDVLNENEQITNYIHLHTKLVANMISMCFNEFNLIKMYVRPQVVYNAFKDSDYVETFNRATSDSTSALNGKVDSCLFQRILEINNEYQ